MRLIFRILRGLTTTLTEIATRVTLLRLRFPTSPGPRSGRRTTSNSKLEVKQQAATQRGLNLGHEEVAGPRFL